MKTSLPPRARSVAMGAALAVCLLGATVPAAAAAPAAPAVATTCESACFLGVRTATHDTYDRLVIDLGGPNLPTWTEHIGDGGLSYNDGGSGESKPVPLTGKRFLTLDFFGVNNYTTTGANSFTGATTQPLKLPAIKGYAMLGGYEGYYSFGLALGDHTRHRVFTLTNPNRLVVDVYR
ncbi:AMIN domain-containing protein [Streptomyces bambusae]|uniref:AMIN domain-containing protein n=1 Tax=Streptomyces bambusae TaxID=1550616 RepID=UPI001CFD1904|nr:AMIN domain-containing protein [Streptomyces bambusae]MCB5165005.1 AMIN domain-containing protein [Streptomyces bambusae]